MIAASFDEANLVLHPPPGLTPEQCEPLNVFSGESSDGTPCLVSCFKVTAEELEEIQRTGRVWLMVFGKGMPPVSLSGKKPITPA